MFKQRIKRQKQSYPAALHMSLGNYFIGFESKLMQVKRDYFEISLVEVSCNQLSRGFTGFQLRLPVLMSYVGVTGLNFSAREGF